MTAMESWNIEGFRYREDDGTETTATWVYAQSTDGTLEVDTNYRMRLDVDAEHTGGGSFAITPTWQYRLNAGTWTAITGSSSVVKAVTSGNVSDGTATTAQLTVVTDTFVASEITTDGISPATATMGIGDHTECELVFQIVGDDVSDADSIELRILDDTTAITETAIPTIEVNKAPASSIDSEPKRWSMLAHANNPVRSLVFNPETSGLSSLEKTTVLTYYGGNTWSSPGGADIKTVVLMRHKGH
jgi:hypothetical protein